MTENEGRLPTDMTEFAICDGLQQLCPISLLDSTELAIKRRS